MGDYYLMFLNILEILDVGFEVLLLVGRISFSSSSIAL
jgi:hypothetical protein